VKLFVGIALSARERAACAAVAQRLQTCGVRGRFEFEEKLHITLAFLGYVDAARVAGISEALREVASQARAFELRLDKMGAFPNERAPRIVYLGAREPGEAFRSLARSARAAYEQLGFTFSKHAVAHVTLARVRQTERAPLPALDILPISIRVRELTLFESLADRARHTTRYEVRCAVALPSAA
jgi:2'-5' RNA ligase